MTADPAREATEREVEELERADRIEEAAELASRAGLHVEAARLFEKACRYDAAARAALAAGRLAHAMELAARSGREDVERDAISRFTAEPEAARLSALRLADLGRPASAGRLLLAIGDAGEAATQLERAASYLEAAAAHEQAGDPRRAARCLETAIDIDAENHAARLALGRLLQAHGRHPAAARALQAIPKRAPERGSALLLLRSALLGMGLSEAVREVDTELTALGLEPSADAPAPARAKSPVDDGQVLFGRYRVVSEVARTPTARVLRAHDTLEDAPVALKLFSAATLKDAGRDALKRFEREAVVLGQLRHPGIVPLVEYLPEGPAVVLAWMHGGSLADLLAQRSISPARAAEIACSVLGALSEAHRRGILHRDIKPANVLFDEAGAAYLADFGTAHVADAAATVTSGVIGTLAYMAPEQRAGAAANAKSDIYGVGALLVHALTGAPPGGRLPYSSSELAAAHRAIVERLVGSEAERPDTALEARDLVRSVAWPVGVPPAHEDATPPPPRVLEAASRLEPLGGALYRDRLLERDVVVVSAASPAAERALAFARADHPALASVLVLAREPDVVWVEAVDGEPLTAPLSEREKVELAEALTLLHRAGGWHGAVDREHVVRRHGRVTLRFPLKTSEADPEADLAALAALS